MNAGTYEVYFTGILCFAY